MPFAEGENVGPYRIMEQLGQGGMATVYKAYHAALDRYVALKVLRADLTDDPTFAVRFQREARLVAKLDHPNIVPIHDFAEHGGHPYLVMKFIEGETLKARLGRGPLTSAEIEHVVDSVGEALAYAHRQGVLHRDIKPSNILLATDGEIYLADFGLARIAQAGESTLSSDAILGTPQYISPEQAIGVKNLTEGTDIYSFGVMLYELVVGKVPFSADTPFAIIHDHIYSPLPLPHQVNPDVPESVERVLLKALAKERSDRYGTVTEMVTAFKSAWEAAGIPMQGTSVVLTDKSGLGSTSTEGGKVATSGGAEKISRSIPGPRTKRSSWSTISIAAGIALSVCCLFVILASLTGVIKNILPGSAQPTVTHIVPTATLPAPEPTQGGEVLLEDDFSSTSNSLRAVFGGDTMTFGLVDGKGYLAGGHQGVLPALYYGSQFGDILAEFDLQAPAPKAGSQYGVIFKGQVAQDGTLDWYYLVGFSPREETVIFACWLYDHWSVEKSFFLPAGLMKTGDEYNHVVLEARGGKIRAFLNNVLVLDLTDTTIENPGVFGLYLVPGEASTNSSQDYAYFDNLRISTPVVP